MKGVAQREILTWESKGFGLEEVLKWVLKIVEFATSVKSIDIDP